MSRPDESARIQAHAERFPESVSSVDAILDGLREKRTVQSDPDTGEGAYVVPLVDAVAAVLKTEQVVIKGHEEVNAWWRRSREVIREEMAQEVETWLSETRFLGPHLRTSIVKEFRSSFPEK